MDELIGPVYRSGLTDSGRWRQVELRSDDIVISAPSMCGTTWVQMICALLIFRTSRLPAPLTSLSPWVDMRLRPVEELRQVLNEQRHRRFLKTHTPPDGLPHVSGVTYVVIGRDPRDVAVSMDHHRANLDDHRIQALLADAEPDAAAQNTVSPRPALPPDQRARVLRWIHDRRPAIESLDSLRAVVAHLSHAWRRRHDPALVLLHHADLLHDLDGQMRNLAIRLEIAVPDDAWPELVQAAGFVQMRAHAADLVPDERLGLFSNDQAFFHSGRQQQWRTILTDQDIHSYTEHLHSLAPPEFLSWLEHRTTFPELKPSPKHEIR